MIPRMQTITAFLAAALCALLVLVWQEYAFFSDQSHKLLVLQEQYREYIDVVRKIARYDNPFDDDERYEGDVECSVCDQQYGAFPDGVRIVSSDDVDDDDGDYFVPLNRTHHYLKEATISYLKEQQLESFINQVALQEWQDYSDQILINSRPKKAVQRPRVPQRRTRAGKRSRARLAKRTPTIHEYNRYGNGLFGWPIKKGSFWLSSFFGPRKLANGRWRFHYGLDMAASRGTPVTSVEGGVIAEARFVSGYGNTVVIAHNNTYKTRYAHLDAIHVRRGQRIKKGTQIGVVGDTGFTIKSGHDASHLHFEVYERGKHINPLYVLPT